MTVFDSQPILPGHEIPIPPGEPDDTDVPVRDPPDTREPEIDPPSPSPVPPVKFHENTLLRQSLATIIFAIQRQG
jgi:hypothetical protein